MNPRVILIEFDDNGLPFSVNRLDEQGEMEKYDIEWCRRDKTLYAWCSGCGDSSLYLENAEHKYWVAASYQSKLKTNTGQPAPITGKRAKPRQYAGDLGNWTTLEDCSYCSVCDDMIPHGNLCKHIWGDGNGDWSTPDDRKEAS